MGESDSNCSGARAHIDNTRRLKACGERDSLFDQVLGFRAWNEHIRSNSKWEAVELGAGDEVLNGLAAVPAFEQFQVMQSLLASELFFRMRHRPGLVFAQQIEEQYLGVLPGSVRVRPHAEARRALLKRNC